MMLKLRKPWKPDGKTEYPAGSLLAWPIEAAIAADFSNPTVLFQPTATRFLQRSPYTTTKNYVLLHLFDNVLRISIEMAAFSMENSTRNAAISIDIRSNHTPPPSPAQRDFQGGV